MTVKADQVQENLDYLPGPESKEVFKKKKKKKKMGLSKGQRSQLEGSPTSQIWDNLNIIMSTMDYNPQNKVRIHECLLITHKYT